MNISDRFLYGSEGTEFSDIQKINIKGLGEALVESRVGRLKRQNFTSLCLGGFFP